MTTFVFGHKSPDTDATLSAIVWAWYLTNIRGGNAEPRLLGEPNTEAAFLLKHWGFPKPEIIADVAAGQQVVIVDTNNPAELPPSINDATIMAIIDHHMLVGGLRTNTPINVVMRPLACTATVMHGIMGEDVAKLPREIKGAMLSCILSDTLEFRSPTTTPQDRAVPRPSPPISAWRSPILPPGCSRRSPMSRPFRTPRFCAWIRRNTRSRARICGCRCWKPRRRR